MTELRHITSPYKLLAIVEEPYKVIGNNGPNINVRVRKNNSEASPKGNCSRVHGMDSLCFYQRCNNTQKQKEELYHRH